MTLTERIYRARIAVVLTECGWRGYRVMPGTLRLPTGDLPTVDVDRPDAPDVFSTFAAISHRDPPNEGYYWALCSAYRAAIVRHRRG